MDFSQILNRAISHKSVVDNTRIDYRDNELKIKELKKQVETLSQLQKDSEVAYNYLEKLINLKSEKFIRRIEGLITYGLKSIFFDEDYSCEIRIDKNSAASIHLVTTDDEGNKITPNIRDAVGGGVRTVIGLLIQFFTIFHTGAEPILFVDEGFSEVSDLYIPRLMAFIKEMADKKDMKVVLITHDDRLKTYADAVYKVEDGVTVKIT